MQSASDIVLRPARWKLCLMVPVSLLFVFFGIWELGTGEVWWGLASLLLFGLAGLACLLALISERFYSLRIGPSGFTYCNFFRCCHIAWDAIATLATTQITSVRRTEFVAWNYSAAAPRPRKNLFMDMSLLGFDAGCPAIGMRAKDIVAIMERYRLDHPS
ncbi:MAG: hypothetical protein H0U23_06155 [Blastocatellia bacterium]|nr:hypothetical protein [Blastocatellia bacterium]